ncbi:MAG: NTP transferase domain-containing protein [Erysipelotrichaceae bacterium]|nr:NTP transferase domain-containing protein [Erysipelotrichaceae bacterium]
MITNKTVIISCAGMGTRLGIGSTKALVDICGKPMIIRQLEMLDEVEDVRIVVGYQAQKVIDVAKEYRKDLTFCFNYNYKTTGTAASFSKALLCAKELVVSLDGDLLVNPQDMKAFIHDNEEKIGGCIPGTDDPVLMQLNEKKEVIAFSREKGDLEWTGLSQVRRERLTPDDRHLYFMLEPLLPLKTQFVRTREIDTYNDYEEAIAWFSRGCID